MKKTLHLSCWPEHPTQTTSHASGCVQHNFHLSRLVSFLDNSATMADFQVKTGLLDFFWQTSHNQRYASLTQAVQQADGFVIFLHGWDGTHETWEQLPQQLVAAYPRLICLNPDVNGFGQSPFIASQPRIKETSLAAAMAAVEYWLELIGVRQLPQRQHRPFFLFVGHSMGGGMVFYKNQPQWQQDVYGCYVMAPAAFFNDPVRRLFYQMVAWGTRIPYVTPIKNLLANWVIWFAMGEASQEAKRVHEHTFYSTSFATLAATLHGIGAAPWPSRTDWSPFRIALGNRDVLVDMRQTLNMLETLGFKPHQVQVTMGDHYFFSHDEKSPPLHAKNLQLVLDDLVTFCQELTHRIQQK